MARDLAKAIRQAPDKNLSQQIYDRLLTMMIQRELPTGTVLQERKLADALNVSRTPAREALNRLETEGYISRRPGNSLIVREITVRELVEILHVRSILESEAIALAIGRVPSEELDSLEAGVRKVLEAAKPDPDDDWEIDSRLHETIAQAGSNLLLAKMLRELRLKTRMFNMIRVPERFRVGHMEHLEIIAALKSGDKDRAKAAARNHIEGVKGAIIRKLSEV
ncbi:GntR family transcriptional regulator [Mesorhizobium sp. WSM4887]|uniref:GntR family transcriptional regulator n=1 Tax=Mesorhizobium sp. WSM4887 TaxID=3038543 RepID=UPI002415F109|nr:GntR family transcriptional regulator [Mesorhizobium sp. WSM4887]MDG4889790.1 GntR family transcriptional regulator [Mesorhizobium sp. WSM4887]